VLYSACNGFFQINHAARQRSIFSIKLNGFFGELGSCI
jgi:hypothetical protein